MDLTSRLGLQKPNPDPVTGDDVDVQVLNDNADKIDAVISFTLCTNATRPTSPFQGQAILESDTGRAYLRVGSNWIRLPLLNSAGTHLILDNAEFNTTRGSATDTVLWGGVTGDSVGRFLVRADGRIEIGPGSGSRDVNLYRRAANHLGTDDSFQSGGYCSGAATESVRTTTVSGITTEQVIQSVTFSAIAGAGYMVQATQHVQSSVLNDIVRTRLRYAAGNSVTTSGTLLCVINPNTDVINRGQPVYLHKLFIAPTTGQYTIGVTMERSGTGSAQAYGDPTQAHNIITVTGA